MRDLRVGFAGLTHLGIVSAVAAAATGFRVVAYDADDSLTAGLAAGDAPVTEPGLPALLQAHGERVLWSSQISALARCDLVYIAADVPVRDDAQSDSTAIRDLLFRVAAAVGPQVPVVVLSQVSPGFTRGVAAELQRWASPAWGRNLYYQVETLIFGQAVDRALHPERFILGCLDPVARPPEALADFLSAFQCPVLAMRYESAELCKIAVNLFLASSITTTNVLAELCEAIGASWNEIAPALRLDRRIGEYAYLKPGLGIGGGNLLRDIAGARTIASRHGVQAGVLDAWISDSDYRRDWALRLLRREIPSGREGAIVAMWGLAYKENTASTFRSPAVETMKALESVRFRAYDPAARVPHDCGDRVVQYETAIEACTGADVLAIMTPWSEFRSIPVSMIKAVMRGSTVVDPYGVLDEPDCRAQGLQVFRMGYRSPAAAVR